MTGLSLLMRLLRLALSDWQKYWVLELRETEENRAIHGTSVRRHESELYK